MISVMGFKSVTAFSYEEAMLQRGLTIAFARILSTLTPRG